MILDLHGPAPLRPPQAGELLVSAQLVYRVTSARPVDSKQWPDRWAVTTTRLARRDTAEGRALVRAARRDGVEIHWTWRYEPGQRASDYRCGHEGCEGCQGTDSES